MGLKDGGGGSSGMDGVVFIARQLEKLRKLDKFPALKRLRTQLQQLGKPKPIIKRSIKSAAATARLRAYMADHSLTQADFAHKAHIGERTLHSLLQKNRASPTIWDEVAHAMETVSEKLFDGD
jgi:DNA-binding XRE family transcriptional regulator